MELEEIVALSVKHNVSDLHLCNTSAARWRRQESEPAPFHTPDIGKWLDGWLDEKQRAHWQANGQVDFALTPTADRAFAPAHFLTLGVFH